jgi:hypothetical protein
MTTTEASSPRSAARSRRGRSGQMTGICSVLGGAAWTTACFVHNSLPQGCIGDTCGGRPLRGSSPAGVALVAVAGVILVVSCVGLLLLARRSRGLGRVGVAAGLVGAAGIALLAAAGVVSTVVDGSWAGMPALVVPGVLLLGVGLALTAWVVLRARILPVPLSLSLLATALLLPFANEQTSRVLLAVPFGVAWLAAGVLLLARATRTRAARAL